ncbi:hypothetical protein DRJ17_05730 [Candidatus Woesearchaeota archaeon]|nr:MAG: hypothetical protein DRJ17_05730 [Candidatus Woesearchaeota archaeon]
MEEKITCQHQHFIIRNHTEYYVEDGYKSLMLKSLLLKNEEVDDVLSEYETVSSITVQCMDCGKIIDGDVI